MEQQLPACLCLSPPYLSVPSVLVAVLPVRAPAHTVPRTAPPPTTPTRRRLSSLHLPHLNKRRCGRRCSVQPPSSESMSSCMHAGQGRAWLTAPLPPAAGSGSPGWRACCPSRARACRCAPAGHCGPGGGRRPRGPGHTPDPSHRQTHKARPAAAVRRRRSQGGGGCCRIHAGCRAACACLPAYLYDGACLEGGHHV